MVFHAFTDWPWKVPLIPVRGPRAGVLLGYALVDEADHRPFTARPWRMSWKGYAVGWLGDREHLMHRDVLGLTPADNQLADHINRDKLDNRRQNLRIVDSSGNSQNLPAIGASRFRGVSWHPAGAWTAGAMIRGTPHKLGAYLCETTAALAAESFRLDNLTYAARTPELAQHEDAITTGVLQCAECRTMVPIRQARYWTTTNVSICDKCSGYIPPVSRRAKKPPQPCENCGKVERYRSRGRCNTCAAYFRRNGRDRQP